ncbi:hypothetical protein C8E01_106267 [Pontibacter virosus]|uniref:Uncharacterized protein n=1 Tax=Pontibacter virosus TaxID=1765052 RepID=A0A2U1AWW3_9BACT|nr:hypothetical protein C8E01_106267 [Pontibacter virosus]
MNKLIVLLFLLLCSCTDDKPLSTAQTRGNETVKRSDFSKRLTSILLNTSYVRAQQTQSVYNSIVKGVRPDMS